MLIMTIPGIGYITAVTILAEIVDHGRFANAEKLVSYAGLSPKHHNSGETVRTGSITKRGSVWLRTAMVEAAFVAVRHDARIGGRYQKLAAPHRIHEGKGGHGQGHARMGLGDAEQRHRVQGNKSGSRCRGQSASPVADVCRHIGSSRIFDGLPAVARRGNHGPV